MRGHPPEISLTEFLTKSLLTAGVVLAIPAALSVAVAALMLCDTWRDPHRMLTCAGWIAFCGIGFFLLFQNIRLIRSPERVRHPRLVWLSVSAYLGIILVAGGTQIWSAFQLAQQGELRTPHGDEIDTEMLLIPALLLVFPFWAFLLSTTLCLRRKCT